MIFKAYSGRSLFSEIVVMKNDAQFRLSLMFGSNNLSRIRINSLISAIS